MQAVLGGAVAALAALLLVDGGPVRRRVLGRGVPLSQGARTGLMGALAAVSIILAVPSVFPPLRGVFFSFCGTCPVPGAPAGTYTVAGVVETFLLGVWYYAATVLPIFVLACALSGAIAVNARIHISGIIRAFLLAAALPLCSCGVIPLGKSMMDRGGASVRSGLMFIAAAPLLSPIVVAIGASVLGWRYVALRVVASFVLALAVALVVPRFLTDRTATRNSARGPAAPSPGGSALLAAWGMLTGLIRYVLFGAVLGAAFAALLPPGFLERILGAGAVSLATTVVLGVPVNLCAGEEVLLTAPLAEMGLTMGHAIAFALAGTGICVSSLPLLRAALGRRATLAMVALYLVIPFVIGVALNALPFTPRLNTGTLTNSSPSIEAGAATPPQSVIDKSR